MKKSKKYISIIIPALALLFISFGLFFSSNLIVNAREEDNTLEYSVNEEDVPGTTGTAGGTTGTVPEDGSSDDSTNDDDTGDENTGDTATKTVSDSITVLVEDPGDGDENDEKPVCSKKTYQCEKGEAIDKKTTEGDNQFVYIWDCELNGETKGCADPRPTCGDFSYNDGSNWTGGCDGGYTAEKKYDKESNTYTWECRGTEGDPIKECSHKPKDGQCKYIEDYYPRGGSYDPTKIFLCEDGKSKNHSVDQEVGVAKWLCPGEEGGKDASCQKLVYFSGVCGSEPPECWAGDLVPGSEYKASDGSIISWECVGPNGTSPDGYTSKVTCYPNDNKDEYIVGQCGDDKGDCIKGQASEVTEAEDGSSSWQCLGGGGGETDYCFLEGPDEPPVEPPIKPPKDPINGVCGSSDGLFFAKEPASNLCEQGELSGKVLKQENNSWAWTCAGLYGGENAKCNTMSVSLTPKLSGCYIGQDQSSCQIEEPFNWLVSGIYNSLSLVTNKSEIALEGESGQKNLEIGYPFSDIKLKVDGGEVASSRAWAVCGTGLYWDSESGTCLKPETCPGEPDYQEPETPYWTYEQTSECEILPGQEVGQLTITGTCQNYDEGHCQKADGTDYPTRTKDKTYSCFLNPPQDIELTVELWAEKENGIPNTESNLVTETQFKIHWKATTNPSGKVTSCDKIKALSPSLLDIETNGAATGVKEAYHPGASENIKYSITCYDKNGHPETATTTVYFGEIDSNVAEV